MKCNKREFEAVEPNTGSIDPDGLRGLGGSPRTLIGCRNRLRVRRPRQIGLQDKKGGRQTEGMMLN